MELDALKEIYSDYIRKAEAVMEAAGAFDGFWGWGDDPKKDPCHMAFYEGVEAFLTGLHPEKEETVFEILQWIICTPAAHKEQAVFWYMFAAHGLCKNYVTLLTPAHCAVLRDFYDRNYPKRDRLPVQRDLYKLLKKQAAKA